MKNWRRVGMKSEWTKKKLSDIADFNPRETIKKGAIAKKIPMDVLRPFYRDIPYYVEECFSGGVKFRNGDTIMARITPCLENGKTAQVSILNDGEVGFGSTEYIVFRAKEGIADKDYLYYLVCSPEVRDPAIKSMVGSSGRQRVQTDVVKNLEIDVPPLVEQEKIGSFLKVFDDKIALNDRINKNLADQTQAIYQQYFVAEANPDWPLGHLSDLIDIKYGKDHKKLADGTYPVYGSGGIMRYVERPLYEKESVLIPRKGTLNNVIYVNQPFWSVDTMFYTEMKQDNVSKFVYHYVKSKDLASMNAGSAVPSMTTAILNALELPLPSIEALKHFEVSVAPMYEMMQKNEEESHKLAKLRDALLPKLMSGGIDVSALSL